MHLHEKGRKDYVNELANQKKLEIKKVQESNIPTDKKVNMVSKIIAKFNQLIKDTDQSLFISDKLDVKK